MALNTKDALAAADLVVFSSDPLSTKYSNQSKNSTIILNAHNHERFAVAPRPKESASPQHPVFGYVGTLGSWFDWNLVIELSEQAPHSSIPLIGPVYTKPRRPLPSNIHLLGPMSNSQAISHMRGFSAGLIPFKINELTDYVDPIKYYEYRTLGLPVFSSSFGQMRERGPNNGVWKMSSGEIGSLLVDFANQLPPGNSSNSSHVPDWSSRLSASKLADLLDSQNRR
jgi:hypothetical protein